MNEINKITEKIIGSAIEVHRNLGPGLFDGLCKVGLLINFNSKLLKEGVKRFVL